MINMVIGEMRYDIIVKRKTTIRDEYGGEAETFINHLYLKSSILFGGGNKVVDNYELFTSKVNTFITHYRDIKSDDIIEYNSENYKIHSIEEIPFKKGLKIKCELINE